MGKNLILFLCWFCWTGIHVSFGQNSGLRIAPEVLYIDGNDAAYKNVGPGDTLYFVAGYRQYLLIKNFKGAEGNPIVMINSGGEVIIDNDHYFGISIQNCRYFRLTGSGNPQQKYGFKIMRVSNGSGLGIGYLSSDFEIDHISIENCKVGGIYAKTDPDCSLSSVRDNFTQYNTNIHDNYIENAGNEGLYVGSTKYFGQTIHCNDKDTLLMPALLDGVRIYNNIIKYSGWDGIQVSSASKNCQIYNNTVLYDSQAEIGSQMSGIIIGGGSKCDCYNNFINNGKGNGIESHGLGGYNIFNNIIINAGQSYLPDDKSQMKHGIFVSDVSAINDSSFYILHNNIINPKSDGIRFSSVKSKENQIISNAIINPGNYNFYEFGNTHYSGLDSYIMIPDTNADLRISNNYYGLDIAQVGFVSDKCDKPADFKLSKGSALIDLADMQKKVKQDFGYNPRDYGTAADIGAWEYIPETYFRLQEINKKPYAHSINNPVDNDLVFKILTKKEGVRSIDIFSSKGHFVRRIYYNSNTIVVDEIILNASDLSVGLYLYRIDFENFSESGKFIKH